MSQAYLIAAFWLFFGLGGAGMFVLAMKSFARVIVWLYVAIYVATLQMAVYAWNSPHATLSQLIFWGPVMGFGVGSLIYVKQLKLGAYYRSRRGPGGYRPSNRSPLGRITDGA